MNDLAVSAERSASTPADNLSPAHDPYTRLHKVLHRAGCFRPATRYLVVYSACILTCHVVAYTMLLSAPNLAPRAFAIVVLAITTVHSAFIAHEAGHRALTRDRRAAALLGQIAHTFMTGLSYSYFRHVHRLHHPHCNDRDGDPDMQSGVFSLYRQSSQAKTGFGRIVSRYQHILIWLLIGLQAWSMKLDGLCHVLRHRSTTRADQGFLLLHAVVWLILPSLSIGVVGTVVNYVIITILVGFYIGSIFLVNHVGMHIGSSQEPITSFHRQLSVTRNFGTSRLADVLSGGLNNHIEHHLFPSIPTARLRDARRITRAFCRAQAIPYRETSWFNAAREATRHLRAMAAHVPSSRERMS